MMTDEQAAGEVEASGSVTVSRVYACPARDQLFLLAVCMRDWLEEGHLAWFVLDVVAEMDTSALHSRTAGVPGRPPYQPEMMCALVLYAYCCAIRSSRRIEAGVPDRCGVPGHLWGTVARSRDDRPVRGRSRAGA